VADIEVEKVKENQDLYVLIDVREPFELIGNMAMIDGAQNIPMGNRLFQFFENADPQLSYVFICTAGYRSGVACEIAKTYGFKNAFNLKGGMVAWLRG
jgi:rhodanese-related sulfurtransferase